MKATRGNSSALIVSGFALVILGIFVWFSLPTWATSPSFHRDDIDLGFGLVGGCLILGLVLLLAGLSMRRRAGPVIAENAGFRNVSERRSIESELQKAADMLKGGLIDEEEYKALKAKIINKS